MVFDEIYEKYFASIIFVCQKFCDSKEDAEEVAQDTFVIASKKLDHIKTDTTLAYLRKIAIRESYRKHNANNHRQQLIVASDEALANYKELDEDFLPEEALQNKEKRARLVGTVEALPKTQRDMVYMYYFADLSVAEIASLMDCSAHNVRQTLYVAKKTLKSRLEKEFGGRVFKSLALVSIGALLLSEEQAFAASYAGALGANPPPAPGPINYYFIGASVLALCAVVAASLYFALRPADEDYYTDYQPYDPHYEATLDPDVVNPDPEELDYVEADELEGIAPEPRPAEETMLEVDVVENTPQVIPIEPTDPIQPTAVEEEPAQELEQIEEEEQALENESKSELEDEVEDTPHVHMDRTAEILEALASSRGDADVRRIIDYFGFAPVLQIRFFEDEIIRAYVTNEGSGDILVGILSHENGGGWYMRFKHYTDSQAPSDVRGLLSFME